MAHKDEIINFFTKNCINVQNEKGYSITLIRIDHEGKFDYKPFEIFYDENDLDYNFSAPRTPQQNGVVERKNRVFQEIRIAMLCKNTLSKYFWAEVVNTFCYVLNQILFKKTLNKILYELWKDKKLNISYFRTLDAKALY